MCEKKIINFNDYKLAKQEMLDFFDDIGLDDFNDIDDLFPLSVLDDEDLSFLADDNFYNKDKNFLKIIK